MCPDDWVEKMSMALLLNANRTGGIEAPVIVSRWSAIKEAGQHLAHSCAAGLHAGGSYIILST